MATDRALTASTLDAETLDAETIHPAPLVDLVADSLLALRYKPWSFGDSVAFEGMLALAERRPDLADFAWGFARGWAATSSGFGPLDCTVPGAALCAVAQRTGDAELLATLLSLAHWLAGRPRLGGVFRTWEVSPLREPHGGEQLEAEGRALLADPGPGVFVDCLHFDSPFFAALSRVTGDATWLDLAVDQARGYVRLLQDRETGLFDHFYLQRTGRSHIPGWGRGQGWALLGLLEVVAELDGDPRRNELAGAARRLVNGMLATQRADGHWNAVVASDAAPAEPSTAAFMAVGFARAARQGVVEPKLVAEPAARARAAVLRDVTPEGVLAGVSVAVWASTALSHYEHTPSGDAVPWGQGPLALMLADEGIGSAE